MNLATQSTALPNVTADLLSDPLMPVDNLLSRLWNTMCIPTLLARAGLKKRSGVPVADVIYVLLLWVWLKSTSIHVFSREALQGFADARKDVIYDYLKREDVNWRLLHTQIARKVFQDHRLQDCELKAFVVDDSVKIRRGKKMAGVSCHFDHLTGRTVKGQQVLTLGLATETTFLPLDQDLFISQQQIQPAQEFKDERSVAAKRYQQSLTQTKPQLLAQALKRAVRNGFEADYLLADAWFGNKPTIRLTESCDVTALLRMKKDKTLYRLSTVNNGMVQHQLLNAADLFQRVVRKQWQRVSGTPYQTKVVDVALNLADTTADTERWINVRLLFSRGISNDAQQQVGKHDWALFLSTSRELTAQAMLEIYALRWGIEVYFKESKQHLGLLKEQTIRFTSHIASISLSAIRYLILLYAALEHNTRICMVRNELSAGLIHLSFGHQLVALFRSLMNHGLEQFRAQLGELADHIVAALEQRMIAFFMQAMQLDAFTLELEAQPDTT